MTAKKTAARVDNIVPIHHPLAHTESISCETEYPFQITRNNFYKNRIVSTYAALEKKENLPDSAEF